MCQIHDLLSQPFRLDFPFSGLSELAENELIMSMGHKQPGHGRWATGKQLARSPITQGLFQRKKKNTAINFKQMPKLS